MTRIIVISSGKGGVGKTTTALNLGAAINHFGEDVIVLDGNITTPNVGIHLGSPEVPINLNQVLSKKADLFEAVYEHESGLKIIPASLSIKELKKLKPGKIKEIKKDLEDLADYIIIDSAAGLGDEARSSIEIADELIIVTNPEMPAITDALKTIKVAEDMKIPVTGTIVTRVKKNDIEMKPEVVKEMLEIPILGMIPEDLDIPRALNKKDALLHVYPKSKPARAYKEIAAKLIGVDYNSNVDKESLMERIYKKFGITK